MINWKRYRTLFPHLQDQIYLNHAAIAPMNTLGLAALQNFIEKRLARDIEFWPAALERKAYFIELISRLIHAEKENLALVGSTSAGLNILALGLSWKAGDRILLNDFEFPSNVIPFTNLRRLGVEIDYVHHRDGVIDPEDIVGKIHPRTRLLSISFVEFLNGFRNQLAAIGEICHRRGVWFCVDAIQGVGALRMDMQEMGIDFLATGGHKWLMWPAGLGFIYISPRIFHQVYPAQAGWMSLENPFDFFNYQQPLAATAQRYEPGVFSTISVMTAIPTLEMMLEIGPEILEKKVLNNTNFLFEKLSESGIKVYSPPAMESRSGIVTFFHPQAEALYQYLKEKKIHVSLREGKIRVSPHFYNDFDDLEVFLQCLRDFPGS